MEAFPRLGRPATLSVTIPSTPGCVTEGKANPRNNRHDNRNTTRYSTLYLTQQPRPRATRPQTGHRSALLPLCRTCRLSGTTKHRSPFMPLPPRRTLCPYLGQSTCSPLPSPSPPSTWSARGSISFHPPAPPHGARHPPQGPCEQCQEAAITRPATTGTTIIEATDRSCRECNKLHVQDKISGCRLSDMADPKGPPRCSLCPAAHRARLLPWLEPLTHAAVLRWAYPRHSWNARQRVLHLNKRLLTQAGLGDVRVCLRIIK